MITKPASFIDKLEVLGKTNRTTPSFFDRAISALTKAETQNVVVDIEALDKLARVSMNSGFSQTSVEELEAEIKRIIGS